MKKIILGGAAIATLLAVYFAPDDDASVVGPAAATTRERVTPAPAATLAAAALPAELQIHPRNEDEDLGNVFAKQSWAPEAPKKMMAAPAPEAPAQATAKAAGGAPPLPFQFMGHFIDEGKSAYFLQADGRNLVARVGEKIDDNYTLDSVSGDALTFTYLPLKQKQSLVVGDLN
ncbi:hypothetical protein AAKU55_003713 [Oxalobacteraceae bacterium GrIS 1.11]